MQWVFVGLVFASVIAEISEKLPGPTAFLSIGLTCPVARAGCACDRLRAHAEEAGAGCTAQLLLLHQTLPVPFFCTSHDPARNLSRRLQRHHPNSCLASSLQLRLQVIETGLM
ncbi:unnamed protein product [Symbiodinium sp. CCMP2456]|nr:unnamed protein product [Symbiodinium sp. CCMP2456]